MVTARRAICTRRAEGGRESGAVIALEASKGEGGAERGGF